MGRFSPFIFSLGKSLMKLLEMSSERRARVAVWEDV